MPKADLERREQVVTHFFEFSTESEWSMRTCIEQDWQTANPLCVSALDTSKSLFICNVRK